MVPNILRDILEKKAKNDPYFTLNADLSKIRASVGPILEDKHHEHFTNHDIRHSERIINKLELLEEWATCLGRETLNEDASFILLSSAYLHDVGMQYPHDNNLKEIRDKHHELSYEMIIGSKTEPDRYPSIAIPDGYHDYIALVCLGHRKIDLNMDDRYNPVVINDNEVNLRLLAALLRFADALDIDHRRIYLERLKVEKDMPLDSQIEWWRHYFVRGVGIKEGMIEIQYSIPESEKETQFGEAIDNFVKRNLEKTYDELREKILWNAKVAVSFKKSIVNYSKTIEEMPIVLRNLLCQKTITDKKRVKVEWDDFISFCRTTLMNDISLLDTKYDRGLYTDREISSSFKKFIKSDKTCFIITGKSGAGKTYLLCNLAEEYIPSLFLTIRELFSNIQEVIRKIQQKLAKFSAFENEPGIFDKINELVKLQNKHFIIFIDDECDITDLMNNGNELFDFLKKFIGLKFKFYIACRGISGGHFEGKKWQEFVYDDMYDKENESMSAMVLDNFSELEFEEACFHYFKKYKIDLKGGPKEGLLSEAKERLKHPLILKLYSEAREGYKNGPEPNIRLITLCDLYWDKKIERVRMITQKEEQFISNSIFEIVKKMRIGWTSTLDMHQVKMLFASQQNIYDCLLSENIIIEKFDSANHDKCIKFMFDEFFEFLMAKQLMEELNWKIKDVQGIITDIKALTEHAERFKFGIRYGLVEFCILLTENIKIEVIDEILNFLLKQNDFRWKQILCRAISKLETVNTEKIEILQKLVHDKSPQVTAELSDMLNSISKKAPKEALEMLVKLIHHKDEITKINAAKSILRMSPEYIEIIVDNLQHVAIDYRWRVCKQLAESISKIEFENLTPFLPVLETLSYHEHYSVRIALSKTLKIIGPKIVDPAIILLTNLCKGKLSPYQPEAPDAIESLAALAAYNRDKVAEIFDELSKSPNSEIKKAVALNVEKVDRNIAQKVWQYLSMDKDIMVRVAVWESLVKAKEVNENDGESFRKLVHGTHGYHPKTMFKKVQKRDGTLIPFNIDKITNAIYKAAESIGGKDSGLSENLAYMVVNYLYSQHGDYTPSVEEIQDAIEKILMENGHAATARAFIIYRHEKAKLR